MKPQPVVVRTHCRVHPDEPLQMSGVGVLSCRLCRQTALHDASEMCRTRLRRAMGSMRFDAAAE